MVVRTTDNEYWVHVRTNNKKDGMFVPGDTIPGKFVGTQSGPVK